MLGLAVREGGTAAADPLVRKLANASGTVADALSGLLQRPDSAALDRFLAAASDTATDMLVDAAWVLADADSVALAQRLMRFAARSRSPSISRMAASYLVIFHVKAGQPAAAMATGESTIPQEQWAHMAPVLATFPFLAPSTAELQAARRRALAWDSSSAPAGPLPQRGRAHLRLYVLGVLSARLGAFDDALRYAVEIERRPAPEGFQGIPANLANGVRAAVAFERREYPLTLALLQRASNDVPLELLAIPMSGGERERFLRAETLLQLGRTAEALPWLENGLQTEVGEVYRAPCYMRLGEAYEQLGQPEKARHYYARALAQWSHAEPAFQPRLAAARERLSRLVSERSASR